MAEEFRIHNWFPGLEFEKIEKLREFLKILLKWNEKINLIGSGTVLDADRVHIADGLLGSQLLLASHVDFLSPIYDLGSGNGIPGLILGILEPQLEIICVDRDERKISFLKNVALTLGLKNLSASNIDVKDLPRFRQAVARGFSSLSKIEALCGPKMTENSAFFHFKGPEWRAEAEKCSTWNTFLLKDYVLPEKQESRSLLKSVPAP